MFVKRILIEQVINLFIKKPALRDDRYGTIDYITRKHYKEHYGKSIKSDFRLLSDIDRTFRMVQQEMPELRGDSWLLRQKLSGEISETEYDKIAKKIHKVSNQLKLEFKKLA